MAAFPSFCAPTRKVQTGSAAFWRPPKSGDQEGDGRPGYPRRSGRPSERDRAVCGCVRSRASKRHRRCVTPPSRSLLRRLPPWKAHPQPSALGLHVSAGFGPSSFSSAGTFAQSDVARWTQVTVLTSEKRRLSRSSRRLQNLSITDLLFPSVRAVLVTALLCSDRYAADWRGPQTQRRYSCGSPSQKFYGNS